MCVYIYIYIYISIYLYISIYIYIYILNSRRSPLKFLPPPAMNAAVGSLTFARVATRAAHIQSCLKILQSGITTS